MAILDKLKAGPRGPVVPELVDEKIRRGREHMKREAASTRLAYRFWAGDHYWYVNEKGVLRFQDTITHAGGGGKPPHRIRNKYNFIRPIVEAKVSAATQRVPSYEVTPATTDPEDLAASRLASQVALFGYEKWNVRRAVTKAVTHAFVGGEGFVMPYFDPNVGPFSTVLDEQTGDVRQIGRGELRLKVFSRNEVFWEPGCDFHDSPWWATEQARPIDEVEQIPGYVGGKLRPDAATSDLPTDAGRQENMVLVTEYLERPCPKYPQGRRLIVANDRVIAPPEAYPNVNAKGEVCDEPVLHRISYTVDPDGDRDRGLVPELIDLQRTINDCWNKLLEWKNRCLNPQMLAQEGTLVQRPTDEPGVVKYYRGSVPPQWEQPPQLPRELVQIRDDAIQQIWSLAAETDVAPAPDLAAKTLQAGIEQSRQRWASFLGDLAWFHSGLMRHMLTLVARHYTEERIVEIRGQYGWEPPVSFTGQDLRSQVNVRVTPDSLVAKSRQSVREEIQFIATVFPGAIPPEAALAAIHGGNAEGLLKSYEQHVARAWSLVQQIRTNPESLLQTPMRMDEFGQEVPTWMPRPQDNIQIHKKVFADYMTTPDYFAQPPEVQEMLNLYWSGLEQTEQQNAMKQMMAQNAMAEQQGLTNAAKPAGAKPLPSQPALGRGNDEA
jgi:hypothetical protein